MSNEKRTNSRRRLLKQLAVGSGTVVVGKSLPENWTKPVVKAVILPTHAVTTDDSGSEDGGQTTPPCPDPNSYDIGIASHTITCDTAPFPPNATTINYYVLDDSDPSNPVLTDSVWTPDWQLLVFTTKAYVGSNPTTARGLVHEVRTPGFYQHRYFLQCTPASDPTNIDVGPHVLPFAASSGAQWTATFSFSYDESAGSFTRNYITFAPAC